MTPPGREPEGGPPPPKQEPEAAAAPLPGPEAAPGAPSPVPWEDAGLSRLQGLVRTLARVLFHSRDFFRNLPREGWAEALSFGLIVGTAGLLACLYWQLLFYLGLSRSLGELPALARQWLSLGAGAIMATMLLAPLVMLANLTISSLGLWGAVGLTGGPWPEFAAVWRLTCYAQGALVAGFLPILGGPVAGMWNLVLTYQGLRGVLGLSPWRALGTVCLSLGLQVLLLLLLLGSLAGFCFFGS
ncbi:MAG: YIP1 family protein [Thermodesulfobacteriota bacterium]